MPLPSVTMLWHAFIKFAYACSPAKPEDLVRLTTTHPLHLIISMLPHAFVTTTHPLLYSSLYCKTPCATVHTACSLAKPEDLVRLTTTLSQLAADLEEHASHLGGRQGEALAAAAAARGAGYAAWRAYYQGHVALAAAAGGGGRWAEAAGLFRRAGERAAAAREATEVREHGNMQRLDCGTLWKSLQEGSGGA
jgi:hypothetical protein